jgi:large subunit ribosomal protein L13
MTPAQLLEKGADKLIMKVVKGMLPKTRLGSKLQTNLRVFAGAEHNMQAQQPKVIDINTLK